MNDYDKEMSKTVDMKELSEEDKQRMRDCYEDLLTAVEVTFSTYYEKHPLSPMMLDKIFAPVYLMTLRHIIAKLPPHTQYNTAKQSGHHLNDVIQHILELESKQFGG